MSLIERLQTMRACRTQPEYPLWVVLLLVVLDGDTLIVEAKDGRGALVKRQGDQWFVSEQITEADWSYFRDRRQKLQKLQQKQQGTQATSKRSKPHQIIEDSR